MELIMFYIKVGIITVLVKFCYKLGLLFKTLFVLIKFYRYSTTQHFQLGWDENLRACIY